MPTFIELYLFVYFFINFFMLSSAKILLKKQTKTIRLFVASVILCFCKFLMDLFDANIYAQVVSIIFASITAMIIVFKIKHVSKITPVLFAFAIYYSLVFAMQFVVVSILQKQAINYISNYFLLTQFSFSLVTFSLFLLFSNLSMEIKTEQLSKECQISIGNTKINLIGYVDTGNKLVDPKSKKSVVIVSGQAIKPHIPCKLYADLILSTNSTGQIQEIHKIKYSTISETNFITVFKPTEFLVSGKKVDCFVGIAPKNITQNYDALLNVNCL